MNDRTPSSGIEKKRADDGISVRVLRTVLILTAVFATALSLFELRQTAAHTQALYELEQERQTCDNAIQQLMSGSDYLTSQVQQFVIKGDRTYMDRYWKEIYETKSRDAALEVIQNTNVMPSEKEAAQQSKNQSDALIRGEIWAMRMVSESVGIAEEEMPADVAAFSLNPHDASLSAGEKQDAAIAYVFGPDYSSAKDAIRSNVTAFRSEISNRYSEQTLTALSKAKSTSSYVASGILVFLVLLIAAMSYFTKLVISPLMAFSKGLTGYDEGHPVVLPERGATEIRQFSRAFNSMSAQIEQNTQRLARLGYIDYLTDVPNRASITEYVTNLIREEKTPLGLMMIDIDNFKQFNDTYGHALGDKVLQRVAQAICSTPPAGSGISGRLCGEEFIVAMQNADEELLGRTAEAILQNVRAITGADVEMPEVKDFRITVSAGGMLWRGEQPVNFIHLLSKADHALYYSKENGKDRYTFFG